MENWVYFCCMARDKELQKRFEEKVIAYFNKYDSIREFGVRKHPVEWCIAKTAHYFDKRPKTIENYLYSK